MLHRLASDRNSLKISLQLDQGQHHAAQIVTSSRIARVQAQRSLEMRQGLFWATGINESPTALSPCKGRAGVYRDRLLRKGDRFLVVVIDCGRSVSKNGDSLSIFGFNLNGKTGKAGGLPGGPLSGATILGQIDGSSSFQPIRLQQRSLDPVPMPVQEAVAPRPSLPLSTDKARPWHAGTSRRNQDLWATTSCTRVASQRVPRSGPRRQRCLRPFRLAEQRCCRAHAHNDLPRDGCPSLFERADW